MLSFNKIGIIGRTTIPGVQDIILNLLADLHQLAVAVYLEATTANSIKQHQAMILPAEELGANCDLVIVVGGDGSMLNAARILAHFQVPVLGINKGNLGFLTDINPGNLSEIDKILAGQLQIEQRFLLQATVKHNEKIINKNNCALNEIAIIANVIPHMMEFSVTVNNSLITKQRSDGIIIATPTGSTAYALAAGGPIVHPTLNAITLVAMSPHSLNIRPVVISADEQLSISLANNSAARLVCDGKVCCTLPAASNITISKYPHKLQLVHPLNYDYFNTLRSKLHWGKKINCTALAST
jgi:NAD+ kinase